MTDPQLKKILEGLNHASKLYLYWMEELNKYFQYENTRMKDRKIVKVTELKK